MRFLVDRCAGRRLSDWLRGQAHDVVEARTLGPDPGDLALLELAQHDRRILITPDNDFGTLVYKIGVSHAGLVRLPDVPAEERIRLMSIVLTRHAVELEANAVVTVRGTRIRISPRGNDS